MSRVKFEAKVYLKALPIARSYGLDPHTYAIRVAAEAGRWYAEQERTDGSLNGPSRLGASSQTTVDTGGESPITRNTHRAIQIESITKRLLRGDYSNGRLRGETIEADIAYLLDYASRVLASE